MKSTSPLIKTSTALPSFRGGFILVILTVASAMLLPEAHAVNPPPDGGYPGFNTAEGQNALLSLDTSTGFANTAIGALSLQSSVDASFNTGCRCGDAFSQHRKRKYGRWRCRAFSQYHRRSQHRRWSGRPFEQQHRRGQHGHW